MKMFSVFLRSFSLALQRQFLRSMDVTTTSYGRPELHAHWSGKTEMTTMTVVVVNKILETVKSKTHKQVEAPLDSVSCSCVLFCFFIPFFMCVFCCVFCCFKKKFFLFCFLTQILLLGFLKMFLLLFCFFVVLLLVYFIIVFCF